MSLDLGRTAGAAHYPGSLARAPLGATLAFSLAVLLSSLAGCGHAPVRPAAGAGHSWSMVPPADPAKANAVLMRALSLVGTPYRYGGNTPDGGFDCSGLVNYVY